MPVVSAAAARKQIAAGGADPLYLLEGDDDIEKSAVAAAFADLVEEDLRDPLTLRLARRPVPVRHVGVGDDVLQPLFVLLDERPVPDRERALALEERARA